MQISGKSKGGKTYEKAKDRCPASFRRADLRRDGRIRSRRRIQQRLKTRRGLYPLRFIRQNTVEKDTCEVFFSR